MDRVDLDSAARAAATGDDSAFAVIVRATQVDVLRACAALADPGSAEDLAQETFLRAYRALPTFAGTSSLRTWLLGIARHTCADELRRRQRRRRLLRRLAPATNVASTDGLTELELLVRDLPDSHRDAFVLTQIVGLSYAEAGAVMQCPIGTVRSRVARARAALIDQLQTGGRGSVQSGTS